MWHNPPGGYIRFGLGIEARLGCRIGRQIKD